MSLLIFRFWTAIPYFLMGITKPCTHLQPVHFHLHPAHFNLHLAPSASTQLISVSTELSATPRTLLEPNHRM